MNLVFLVMIFVNAVFERKAKTTFPNISRWLWNKSIRVTMAEN